MWSGSSRLQSSVHSSGGDSEQIWATRMAWAHCVPLSAPLIGSAFCTPPSTASSRLTQWAHKMYFIQASFFTQTQTLSAFPNVKGHFFLLVTHLLRANIYLQITEKEHLQVICSTLLCGNPIIAKDPLIKQAWMFTESLYKYVHCLPLWDVVIDTHGMWGLGKERYPEAVWLLGWNKNQPRNVESALVLTQKDCLRAQTLGRARGGGSWQCHEDGACSHAERTLRGWRLVRTLPCHLLYALWYLLWMEDLNWGWELLAKCPTLPI